MPLRDAASLACRQLLDQPDPDAVALDAAAEALARIVTVYQEVGGRLVELPLEDRVLGSFEGGAARFSAAGGIYRRLYVRRGDLEDALAALPAGASAVPALAKEQQPGEHSPARE